MERNPRDSEKTVNAFSFTLHRRLHASGAVTVQLDDVKQEMWLAWCKARDTYQSDRGASFKTYLVGGMLQHARTVYRNYIKRRWLENAAASFEGPIGSDEDDDFGSVGSTVPSPDPTPVEMFEGNALAKYGMSKLSEQALAFVKLFIEQPPELLAVVQELRAKGAHASTLGIRHATPQRLTAAIVFDAMGAPRKIRTEIMKELREKGAKLST